MCSLHYEGEHRANAARLTTASTHAEPERKVSALVWLIPLVAFWVIVGLALT